MLNGNTTKIEILRRKSELDLSKVELDLSNYGTKADLKMK